MLRRRDSEWDDGYFVDAGPLTVDVHSCQVKPRLSMHYPVRVYHRQYVEVVLVTELLNNYRS